MKTQGEDSRLEAEQRSLASLLNHRGSHPTGIFSADCSLQTWEAITVCSFSLLGCGPATLTSLPGRHPKMR